MKLFYRIIFKIILILTILAGCAPTEQIKKTDSDELLNQGIALLKEGKHDQAIAYFNKATEINPRYADAYYYRGRAYYFYKGQYDKAISDYTKATEINPRYADAYHYRGLSYCGKGLYDKAVSDFTKAIEINPRHAMAYYNRGIAYFYKRDYEEAWDDVHKAESLGFIFPPSFHNAIRQASGREK